MITDEELLAACRSAGEPGSASHRAACRLYRRSVLEWRAGHASGREAHIPAAVMLRQLVTLCGRTAEEAGWLAPDTTGSCGSHSGYVLHSRYKTPVCTACEEAERAYSRSFKRKRARRRPRAKAALAAEAVREAA